MVAPSVDGLGVGDVILGQAGVSAVGAAKIHVMNSNLPESNHAGAGRGGNNNHLVAPVRSISEKARVSQSMFLTQLPHGTFFSGIISRRLFGYTSIIVVRS